MSLSMRWTMPGRATPPIPLRRSAAMMQQGVDQRPVAIARGRMDDQARGLVDDQQMLVLVRRSAGGYPAARYAPEPGSGTARVNALVALDLGRRVANRLAFAGRATPALVSTFSRSREREGIAAASARSSRQPAWLASSAISTSL